MTEVLLELHSAYIHTSIHLFAIQSTVLSEFNRVTMLLLRNKNPPSPVCGYNSLQLVLTDRIAHSVNKFFG